MSDGKPALPVLNLTVVYRPTNSIKPESRNARTHSKKQVAEIAASIRQFGFANPLLIDVNSVLIAGHGRLLAAKSTGLDLAPTITCRISTRHKDARCVLPIIRLRSTQGGMWTC
jgi:ParB-like chromosome segregation protein Spo0J